jgi:hypothetical protein
MVILLITYTPAPFMTLILLYTSFVPRLLLDAGSFGTGFILK